MNEITITGNLVSAPKLRVAGTQQVARFRLAHNHSYRDAGTGEWTDNGTTFIEVSCWRSLAENVYESLDKGAAVIVTGRLRSREWEMTTDNGDKERRTSFEIEATNIGPDLTRSATRMVARRTEPVARQEDVALAEALGTADDSPFEPVLGEEMPAA